MQTASHQAVRHGALARGGAALALALATVFANLGAVRAIPLEVPTGLSQLLAAYSVATPALGIAEFTATPTGGQVASLRSLGLVVQPMRHLPLALVYGTVGSMQSAVNLGLATDVYPNDPIELFDTASANAWAPPRSGRMASR